MAIKKGIKVRIREYDALRFKQRGLSGPQFVMFVAPVKAILEFAEVDQLTPTNRGPQREQKEARVQAIRKFIGADKSNAIPTAVILAFHLGAASFKRGLGSHIGTLTIKLNASKKVAAIVDGQHRLFGILAADPNMEVAVVA